MVLRFVVRKKKCTFECLIESGQEALGDPFAYNLITKLVMQEVNVNKKVSLAELSSISTSSDENIPTFDVIAASSESAADFNKFRNYLLARNQAGVAVLPPQYWLVFLPEAEGKLMCMIIQQSTRSNRRLDSPSLSEISASPASRQEGKSDRPRTETQFYHAIKEESAAETTASQPHSIQTAWAASIKEEIVRDPTKDLLHAGQASQPAQAATQTGEELKPGNINTLTSANSALKSEEPTKVAPDDVNIPESTQVFETKKEIVDDSTSKPSNATQARISDVSAAVSSSSSVESVVALDAVKESSFDRFESAQMDESPKEESWDDLLRVHRSFHAAMYSIHARQREYDAKSGDLPFPSPNKRLKHF
ncbi:unnamed protein product [Aphanomyces euteiches]|uniref:Uncharacterized protein n=1 Tax=Aphanomyces euteiches TaxID=100861 RepID=A0A6G0XK61_9STRA|nr:hypothetical protein Ae201684_003938 [Aphanomyces euteiches]KAH9084943.1 hypothetical protein Ae201684P_002175 [Aphanomyces euteiches]KAH9143085.1 hypothetical protein AeRB84_012908 [Aphanomyces euteiches]